MLGYAIAAAFMISAVAMAAIALHVGGATSSLVAAGGLVLT